MRPKTDGVSYSARYHARKLRFLARLKSDASGNALMITAACMIPLAAAIGGGVDMSRAYLAKARLNQACDAAAIAGRRAMTNENIETAKPEATKFFNFNFPQGTMETAAFVPKITRPDTGLIRVEATTTVPTSIMKIFGYTQIPISVSCDATQNCDNIDVVLVLDVTGSMDGYLGGEKRIVSLRKAVVALYDELASAQKELEDQGLRLRYGVVPYSTTVNVGKLVYAKNASYIADEWEYHSREYEKIEAIEVTKNWCDNRDGSWVQTSTGNGNPKGTCTFTDSNPKYKKRKLNTATYKTGALVDSSSIVGGWNNNNSWNGCIEERQTVASIDANHSTKASNIPPAAFDLNIDRIPNSPPTRWGPQWRQVTFDPDTEGNPSAPCPTEAKKLKSITRTELENYVNSLVPTGNTYHDIGMIWGARLISGNGIFGDENPSEFNGRPVNRFIIYMTDGELEPNPDIIDAYGLEKWNRRTAAGNPGGNLNGGKGSDLEKRHSKRFVMACNATKELGVSIWTIAFGTSASPELQDCASNSDQVATSANSTELINKFKEIGKNIGALRLAK